MDKERWLPPLAAWWIIKGRSEEYPQLLLIYLFASRDTQEEGKPEESS